MVPANSDRVPPAPPYSGYQPPKFAYVYGTFTLFGVSFQRTSTSLLSDCVGPTTPRRRTAMVWALPLSLATTYGITIVFSSSGYLDVSVPRVTFPLQGCTAFNCTGCPIRTSADITLVCSSPQLFAAYHVLRRL